MSYRRMTYETRLMIERFYNILGYNGLKISRELGFTNAAIYYELKRGMYLHRNSDWTETKRYSADIAQRNADFNRETVGAQPKIQNDHETLKIIENLILTHKLSPAAALATIEREHIPVKTKMCLRTLYH